MKKFTLLSLAAALFIGCASVNDYELKEPKISGEEFKIKDYSLTSNDEFLSELLHTALDRNEDIKIALNSLKIAESSLKSAGIARQPSVNLSYGANEQFLKNSNNFSHSLDLNLSYEIDLFNRLGKLKQNALLNSKISEFDLENVRQMIGFSVAKLYYQALASKKKIEILQDFTKSYEKTLKMREAQYRLGSVTKSTYLQTKEQYSQINTRLKAIKLEQELYENALKALVYGLGDQSSELKFAPDLLEDFSMPSVIPSSVMTNRPDIAKAIMQVKIRHNEAKIAHDGYFPRFNIFASIKQPGTDAKIFSDPLAVIGANIVQPIFNLGDTKEKVIRANLAQDIAVLNYEKTVKTALKEVQDAILKYQNATERLADYEEIIKLEREIYKFNELKFNEGAISFMEFLDSERALQNSLIEQIDLQLGKILAGIDAYKAIGIKKLEF